MEIESRKREIKERHILLLFEVRIYLFQLLLFLCVRRGGEIEREKGKEREGEKKREKDTHTETKTDK